MNSVVLPRNSFAGIQSAQEPHALVLPKRRILRKSLVACGVGLALSVAFFWGLFIKAVPAMEPFTLATPPNQAVYEWQGFHRVAPTIHFKGLNPL